MNMIEIRFVVILAVSVGSYLDLVQSYASVKIWNCQIWQSGAEGLTSRLVPYRPSSDLRKYKSKYLDPSIVSDSMNRVCRMVCKDGFKPAGPKTRLICLRRFDQWQLRGNYYQPTFSCIPRSQPTDPTPVKPAPTGPPCQISDFKQSFMKSLAKRYPKSKYTFSLSDFRIQPRKEGERLKFKMLTGVKAKVHSGSVFIMNQENYYSLKAFSRYFLVSKLLYIKYKNPWYKKEY